MTIIKRPSALAAAVLAIAAITTTPVRAQDDVGTLVDNAFKAMKAERWEEGLALNTQAIQGRDPKQALTLFGPKFGIVYYQKGICEMKLQKWGDAMASFETCYKDFPNPKDAGARANPVHKKALLSWAEAAAGAKEWKTGVEKYLQFLKERDPQADTYQQGAFHIGIAICYYNLDNIEEGNKHLKTAIDNKLRFPTPDNAIISAFQELVNSAIRKRDEASLLAFVAANRGGLTVEPYIMHRYSKLFLKLAYEALEAEMDATPLALYQFIPPTDAAIDDVRARLKALGPLARINDGANILVKADLEKDLEMLEAERRGGKPNETILLSATAFIHEKNGDVRGAYAAYLQLETHFSNAEKREDNLFNLVRTTSLVGNVKDTLKYAETFQANYPDSKYIPSLRRIMLSSLFYDGEYAECIGIAEPMLPKLEPGSPEHDMCLHVLGGSYYYTAEFDKAQPLLDQHVKDYPESIFAMAAAFFQASNLSRLGDWKKAGELLDAFIAKYPDGSTNNYLPLALFDRANCHSSLEEAEPALNIISRLVRDFPNSTILDQAFILRGNIEQMLTEKPERAEQAYLTALDTAVKLHHKNTAGEALFWMINLIGTPDSDRLKDAVPFADRFWNEFAEDSPLRSRIAIGQFPALAAVDRTEDGLKRLQEVIVEASNANRTDELEQLIPTYTDAYLTKYTPEQLKNHFFDFPGIKPDAVETRALLRVAVIGVYEKIARESEDESAKSAASALVQALFQQLKKDFDLTKLTPSILVRIGDFLRIKTATPREAIPYYDEALARNEPEVRFRALVGRGTVYATSSAPADIDKALADFAIVYAESDEKAQKETALYRTVELLVAKKSYEEAAKQALVYLDKANAFGLHANEVGMLLARTFDERNMMEDAIAMYLKVWSPNMGDISVSAPAMKRWMELSWQRNRVPKDPNIPADRQGAYEGGFKYIELTSNLKKQMTPEQLRLWKEVETLVQNYEADPKIKSMADIRREKEKAGGIRIRR